METGSYAVVSVGSSEVGFESVSSPLQCSVNEDQDQVQRWHFAGTRSRLPTFGTASGWHNGDLRAGFLPYRGVRGKWRHGS